MTINKLKKVLWIYNQIVESKGISLKALQDKWEVNWVDDGKPLPTSSFRKYKNNIEELFNVSITCTTEGQSYVYTIKKSDISDKSPSAEWLAQMLSIEFSWNSMMPIRNRIVLDKAPIGGKYISTITEAISESKSLEIEYQSFYDSKPRIVEVDPFWLKMYNQRWYLVANLTQDTDDEKEQKIDPHPYSLDRIKWMKITDKSFKYPKELTAESHFKDSVGITVDMEYDIETVQFKVYGTQQNYVATLPIHPSQSVMEQTDEYTIFQMVVRPSYELFEKLIAQQYHLEVLSPKWIREEMASIIDDMAKRYR